MRSMNIKGLRSGCLLGLLSLNLSCGQSVPSSATPTDTPNPTASKSTTTSGSHPNSGAWISFEKWIQKCDTLPPNRKLGMTLPPKEILPMQNLNEFRAVLNRFMELQLTGPLSQANHWVGEATPDESFFDTSRVYFERGGIPFQPFTQKLTLGANSTVLFHGDLHGDLHSLNTWLKHLNDEGILNGFKIQSPDTHMIFLGDYTDRGAYGVEVMYVLLRLRVENPSQVWMARGNHEDIRLTMEYGFLREANTKYGPEFPVKPLSRIYDFLPVVIYLGNENNFLQCNHGGMEPGYNPSALLDHPSDIGFQLLGTVRQKAFLDETPGIDSVLGSGAQLAQRNFKDHIPTSPSTPTVLGFMWNDFTITRGEAQLAIDPGRAWVYGDQLTKLILKQGSTANNRIRAIMRAHQHSSLPNALMRRLVHSKGVFRHWQESIPPAPSEQTASLQNMNIETETERSLVDGAVYTFNVAPDSYYGTGNKYDFDAFGMLRFGTHFKDWKLEVFNLTNIKW